MSSAENQQHTFPAVPPSLSADDHELRDYYAVQNAPRPILNQAPYLTPYLGLRARLSQIWINKWTILLFLVLVRTLIAVASINDNLESARREALSACTNVETLGSSMASLPHYMSKGTNELAAHGVEKAVNGLMSMLTLTVTGAEEIFVFVVNMLTQTYLCLITFAITGSLHAALDLVEKASDFVNKTLTGAVDDVKKGATDFQNSLNGFLKGISGIPLIGSGSPPKIDLTTQLDKISNLKLPSDLHADLDKLNASIPDFKDVKNFTETALRLPFEKVKQLINESLPNYQFNDSFFPVPAKQQLTFCSDDNGINDFFDKIVNLEIVARKVFIGVIVVLAILVCIPMAWREMKRWKMIQERACLATKNGYDPLDLVYITSRPHSSMVGIKLANRFTSVRNQTLVRWAIAYATSTPALFVLSLGIAGLFACLCQFVLLKIVERQVPELSSQVGAFAEKVVFALNNASESWANGTNQQIILTNNRINQDVFGWVNTSTTALNDTLNEFVDKTTEVLNKVFGGTILQDPIQEVFNCLIGLKIEGFQKGLTWVHDNAHIDFPLFKNDTFSVGAVASLTNSKADDSFLANPGSKTKDEITDVLVKLADKIGDGIRTEALIATALILLWLLVAIIGFIRICVGFAGHGKTRAEGGQAYMIDPATDNLRGHDYRPQSCAPPYEQTANEPAPYTIQPRPFPRFGDRSMAEESHSTNEKFGSVERNVPESKSGHVRSSSYGQLGGSTPIDEKRNPFSDWIR